MYLVRFTIGIHDEISKTFSSSCCDLEENVKKNSFNNIHFNSYEIKRLDSQRQAYKHRMLLVNSRYEILVVFAQ